MDDLIAEASEEATQGSKQYADGQSQLSAAMIPYSMKYTDVYTANLSALTGGTSSGATAYESQAIAETNGSDELADAQSKVDAAMSTLATASEHTGKATALRRLYCDSPISSKAARPRLPAVMVMVRPVMSLPIR